MGLTLSPFQGLVLARLELFVGRCPTLAYPKPFQGYNIGNSLMISDKFFPASK